MVKHIDADGFIRFQGVGGLNPQVLVSQRVIIHGRRPVKGVIVPRRSGEPLPALEEMLIDVGLPREEVCEAVEVGDIVTFAQELEQLNDKVYVGRNFDDRIGTYCLLDAMENLGPTEVDVYAVSSVQEEVGVRGMPMAAYAIEPDIGLALDGSVTWGAHIPKHDYICAMGEGTGIYLIDNLTIGDRRLIKFLIDLCEAARDRLPAQHRRRNRCIGHSAHKRRRAQHHRRRARSLHALNRSTVPRRRHRSNGLATKGLSGTRPRIAAAGHGSKRSPRLRIGCSTT